MESDHSGRIVQARGKGGGRLGNRGSGDGRDGDGRGVGRDNGVWGKVRGEEGEDLFLWGEKDGLVFVL